MTDLEALLVGVSQAFPDNEPERLVLADYYEDRGNETDAEACRNVPVPQIVEGAGSENGCGGDGYGFNFNYGNGDGIYYGYNGRYDDFGCGYGKMGGDRFGNSNTFISGDGDLAYRTATIKGYG